MQLIRQAVSKHSKLIPGIEGYLTLVDKVEKNVGINPDIAIESCKSLIEGLCLKALSLLSDKYIDSTNFQKKCKNNYTFLTETAFSQIYSSNIEKMVHQSLSNLIIDTSTINKIKDNAKRKVEKQTIETVGKISAIRNNRGDIAHGRNYPKDQESSIALAKSINSIVDGICYFMIEELANQYSEKLKKEGKLIYEDLEDFNIWLDEKHNVSTIKIDFSRLLYDNAYAKYDAFYYQEYVNLEDADTEEESNLTISDRAEVIKIDEIVGDRIIEEKVESATVDIVKEPATKYDTSKIEATDSNEVEVVKLVNTFNEIWFWTGDKVEQVQIFALAKELKLEELKELINQYFFTEKEPLRDDVIDVMNIKPPLKERAEKAKELTTKIIALAEMLNTPTEEV
jgi:hypothetical protein